MPAFVRCRGGCTAAAARPAVGAPRPPSPSLRSALPPWLPCPVLSVPGGPRRPCPCPWAPSRPPRLCPPVRAVGPAPCHPRPGLHCRRPCPSRARALPVPVPMPLAAPTLADRASLRSMRSVAARLGALLAPLRFLPVPLPLPGSLSRVAPSAARALSHSAAAVLGALPAFSPSLLAACGLACPLRV